MSVPTTFAAQDFAGATINVPLAVNFPVPDINDIYMATKATGATVFTTKVPGVDFTLQDLGGGSYTLTPLATWISTTTVRVFRMMDFVQDFDFAENGPLPAQRIEAMGDYITMLIQNLRLELGLSVAAVSLPAGNTLVLPTAVTANATTRGNLAPAFLGQILVQLSDGTLYRGASLAAGGWTLLPVPASPLPVSAGGSGLATLTPWAIITGGTTGTGAMQQVASVGTSGQVLTSAGAGALPTFQTPTGGGDVVGPASAVDSVVALFSGTTGKLLKATQGTNAAVAATLNLGTITDTTPRPLTITQTRNNAALINATGIVLDITDTAIGANASHLSLRSAGTDIFSVGSTGNVNVLSTANLSVRNITGSSAGGTTITGGGGNMSIVAGTGSSRTLTLWIKDASSGLVDALVIGITGGTTVYSLNALLGLTSSDSLSGVGYAAGAGGSVTQATNRTTGVTLNKVTGAITTNTTSLAAGASASFTVTNSAVAATDVIILSQRSGATNVETFCKITAVAAGSFQISVVNLSASVAEVGAIIINFAVIKAKTT